jgi:hypothetical protein
VTASTLQAAIANAARGDRNPSLSAAAEHLLRWVGSDRQGEHAAVMAQVRIQGLQPFRRRQVRQAQYDFEHTEADQLVGREENRLRAVADRHAVAPAKKGAQIAREGEADPSGTARTHSRTDPA